MYNRFRTLTGRIYGLPAAKAVPGYLDVPLKFDFLRYVLLKKIPPRRMLETVPLGMLKEAKVKMKWDDMLHFGILYEISFGGNASAQINMKCSLVRPPVLFSLGWQEVGRILDTTWYLACRETGRGPGGLT